MPAPQITALPDPPSRQDPTNFAVKGDAFLGALPTFATEANALATQVNERVDAAFAAGLESAATNAATTVTKAAEARASELAAAGFANEAMLLSLGVETLRPSIKPSLLLDFARAQVVPPSVTFTRASTATRVGPSGLIETVGINVPRLDYDPITRACLGLLIEEQRTNLVKNSGVPFNDGRAIASVTREGINLYTATGDGNTTAYVGGSGVGNTGFFSVTSGVVYAVSFWVKQTGSDSSININFLNSVGTSRANQAFLSITTEAVRRTVYLTANATDSVQLLITGVSTGQTLELGGVQVEAGAFPTSYIPTTTASVTRAKDFVSVNTLSPWYRADEGSLFVDFDSSYYRNGATNNTVGFLGASGNGMTANSVSREQRLTVASGGVTQANNQHTVVSQDGYAPAKFAFAYKANDFASVLNGGTPILDASGSVPAVSKLDLTTFSSMTIRQIKYFPQRLVNAQLQALTTL